MTVIVRAWVEPHDDAVRVRLTGSDLVEDCTAYGIDQALEALRALLAKLSE